MPMLLSNKMINLFLHDCSFKSCQLQIYIKIYKYTPEVQTLDTKKVIKSKLDAGFCCHCCQTLPGLNLSSLLNVSKAVNAIAADA